MLPRVEEGGGVGALWSFVLRPVVVVACLPVLDFVLQPTHRVRVRVWTQRLCSRVFSRGSTFGEGKPRSRLVHAIP